MTDLQPISVRGRHFVRHIGICNTDLCPILTGYVRCHSAQFKKKTTSLVMVRFEFLKPDLVRYGFEEKTAVLVRF